MCHRHNAAFAENLRRFLSGEPLIAVVDKKLGYWDQARSSLLVF
jgi:hypothetical protein